LLIDSTDAPPLRRLITWKQTCASANDRKVMKAEPSQLISRKLAANLDLSIVEK